MQRRRRERERTFESEALVCFLLSTSVRAKRRKVRVALSCLKMFLFL